MAQVIGRQLDYGFAGNYARQSDMIIDRAHNAGTTNIVYGMPCMFTGTQTSEDGVTNVDATFTADNFAGIAVAAIKSPNSFVDQGEGGAYRPDEMVGLMQRGSISVISVEGTPYRNAPVYVRVAPDAGGLYPIGDFTTVDTAGETVLLPNAVFHTDKDGRNVTEIRLKTILNV